MRNWALAVAVMAGLLVSVPNGAAAAQTGPRRFDGHWWTAAASAEQRGFVSGYLDCYVYEYKGPAGFSNRSTMALQGLITRYYQRGAASLDEAVPGVLSRYQDRPGDTVPAQEGAEVHFEPHGFFDGDFWRQITGPERLGFLEGYLLCHATQSRNQGGAFSRSVAEYQNLITRWYRLNEATDEIDEGRAREKIADVLFRFRDGGSR